MDRSSGTIMKKLLILASAAGLVAASLVPLTATSADARSRHKSRGIVTSDGSVTGGRGRGQTISRGATGASTISRNSAAGGNANQPERAVPQGSGGGGSGGAGAQ
jgi:hypothetical protein